MTAAVGRWFRAGRGTGAAGIAVVQGNTDAAKTLAEDARADLATVARQAPKDIPDGAPTADGIGTGNADVIPIDGQAMVADDMVLTADTAVEVEAANDRPKNGDTAKAMDTPKQGAIDVAVTRVLMPVEETDVHADAAAGPLDRGRSSEADLALEAARDLFRADAAAFGDTAPQGRPDGRGAGGRSIAGGGFDRRPERDARRDMRPRPRA